MFGAISPGDKFRPSARWLNSVNQLVNEREGRTGEAEAPPAHASCTAVQVYNAGSSALVIGQAVEFVSSGAEMSGEMIPCSALSDASRRFGLLTNALDPNDGGGCVVAGPVKIDRIIGSGAEFVLPVTGSGAVVSGAQVWSRTPVGLPLLFGTSSGGVVLLERDTEVRLATVSIMPTGGTGAGAVRPAMPAVSGGVIVDSGTSLPMAMPYIDGAN